MGAGVQGTGGERGLVIFALENNSLTLGGETPPLLLNSELRTPNSELRTPNSELPIFKSPTEKSHNLQMKMRG